MLEQIYTSAKAITTGTYMMYCWMCYVKAWDAMVFYDRNATSKVSKLFRDGSMATIITVMPSLTLESRVDGRHCWMDTSSFSEGHIFGADEVTGNFHSDQLLQGAWVAGYEAYRAGNFIDDKRNLALYSYVAGRVHFIDLVTGSEIAYMTLPGTSLNDHIAWAGEGKVVVIDFETGKVNLIDYVNRTIIWTSTIRPCSMAAYDCTHNLVITVESDKLIRVYTIDPVPAVLSAPSWEPTAAHMHRLMGSKVKTRLTGSAGEVCPDYWIHWSLLGLPAKGELLKDKSKTDALGYAENYYFGPRAVGEIGEETVQVSVKVPS